MFTYRVINSSISYIEEDGKNIICRKNKLFDGDIVKDDIIIKSKNREIIQVGLLNTYKSTIFGKNKKGSTIYIVEPLKHNLPKFLVAYNGKIKGKLIVRFKFINWNKKLPTGILVNIIGLLDKINMDKLLLYHHNINTKKIIFDTKVNNYEKKIVRKDLTDIPFISIDPTGSTDIDDAIYINNNMVYVTIAQPIVYLNKNIIEEMAKTKFSTIYSSNNIHLFGEKVTELSSLIENKLRYSYTVVFKDGKLYEHYPSIVMVRRNYSYDYVNTNMKKYIDGFEDAQSMISHYMILTNLAIGNIMKNKNMIYRITKGDSMNAIYTFDDTINYHSNLDKSYYLHFTSPIRRLVDNIIHMKITYNIDINNDIDIMNEISTSISRFHRNLELDKNISNIVEDIEYDAKLIEIRDYSWYIYIDNIGYITYNIIPKILTSLTSIPKLKIGSTFKVKLYKRKGILPKNKLIIVSKYDLFKN